MEAIRFYFETLGCKVNQYETQALEALLRARGHTAAQLGDECDAVIVNTCTVTSESGRKSRQAIRRLKKQAPNAIVAVCGCFSQMSPEEIEALGVHLIGGSGDRQQFAQMLERVAVDKGTRRLLDDPQKRSLFEELPAGSVAGRTRAMLKIQDGCQNYCTYCIIPYARGPVRSLALDKIRAQAERLSAEGFGEIVVTGIEIASYGLDLPEKPTLMDAIAQVSSAAPKMRVRLGSLEPRIVTAEFCARLAGLANICPHFHLSLQSGCDETLRRMKRRYTTSDFFETVQRLRQTFPDCGITADLIVGFPGETQAEFEQTLAFIKKCAFSSMHIFPFSKRPGTLAAEMTPQIENDIKRARARRATQAANDMSRAYAGGFVGSVLNVLFERETAFGACGHTGNYLEVCVAQSGLRNVRHDVRIDDQKDRILYGEIIKP